jgi:hypothetical protein
MEFFRLKRLNATLVHGPLPARDTAQYLAAQSALWSLILIPSPADAPTDWTLLAYPALSLLGVYHCYRRHGGAAGERFAERYLAIGWVVGLRVAALLILLAMLGLAAFVAVRGFDGSSLDSPRMANVLDVGMLGVIVVVYWRMGVQLAAVHHASHGSSGKV